MFLPKDRNRWTSVQPTLDKIRNERQKMTFLVEHSHILSDRSKQLIDQSHELAARTKKLIAELIQSIKKA